MNKRIVAAIELSRDGIAQIVMIGKTEAELAETHRMLARATPALEALQRAIRATDLDVSDRVTTCV